MLKTTLLAGALCAATAGAFAADLPSRAAPPVPFIAPPLFTWTGFYAGLESAYAFTDRQQITTTGISTANINAVSLGQRFSSVSNETDGSSNIGGTVGYNYQFTPGNGVVVGVAANVDWTDLSKNTTVFGTSGYPSQYRQSLDWLGTATGKIGYAFDRFLVYGTGGFAFGNVEYRANFYNVGTVPYTLRYAGRYDDIATGYAYGGGVEYAIPTDSFLNYFSVVKYLNITSAAPTVKVEYLHYDLGHRNVAVANTGIDSAAPGLGYTSRFRTEGNIVRAGFNYKFGTY